MENVLGSDFTISSFAATKWLTTQTLVMKIGVYVKALQLSSHRNPTTKCIVTHIKHLQLPLHNLGWNFPKDLVMVKIQISQGSRKHNLRHVEL